LVAPLAIGTGIGFGLVLGASAVTLSPAAASAVNAAVAALTSCSSSAPCVAATNASTGAGIAGTSAAGPGVRGISTSSYGVSGTSKTGIGVQAVSTSANALYAANNTSRSTIDAVQNGSGPAITATAGAGPAVNATSVSGAGVSGASSATFGAGVSGTEPNGYGIRGAGAFGGYFTGSSYDGVLASTATAGYAGIAGADHSKDGGYGVYGSSDKGTAGTFSQTPGNTQTAFAVYGGTAAGIGSLLMDVRSSDDNGYLDLDDSGNLTITGTLSTSGSCSSGCIASRVRSYAPHEAQPTMEDVGRSRLAQGSAYIALDPAFANVVDATSDYSVLVTPEGDSNGVFVAQRTRHGFIVRENRGGHSSVAFSYRIVAKPYGNTAPRLPMFSLRAHPRTVSPARALPLEVNAAPK
jgi:hypothetical protein